MLERCFLALKERGMYNKEVFKICYPLQDIDHPCHVHVIGMIFVKAGIATSETKEKNYFPLK